MVQSSRISWLWLLPFIAGIGTGVVMTISMKYLGSSSVGDLDAWMHAPPSDTGRDIVEKSSASKKETQVEDRVLETEKPEKEVVVSADSDPQKAVTKDATQFNEQKTAAAKQAEEKKMEDTKKAVAEEKKKKTEEAKPKKPLNVVLLYADDMRHDSIGIAGTSIVQTPHIDDMARKGIRFTHNCVTTSVCWISRATLYSGKYFSRHNTSMPNDAVFYEDWNSSWPHLLNEAGYHLGHVGKWHFDSRPIEHDWHFWRSYYGSHFMGKKHVTKKNEEDALDFLHDRPKDKPFVLSVCFFAPHSEDGNPDQYIPQNSSMSLYQDVDVPLPKSANRWEEDKPPFFGDTNEARYRWRLRFSNPELHQRMMKNYYRLISEIDHAAGSVMSELERQGILDETMVIFTTDNGYFHSEHGFAGKWYPHQESIRVPLVVWDPRMPKEKAGATNDAFTLNVDLAETILGAAGVNAPGVMQGRDISDLYVSNPKDTSPWREEFFYEHPVHLHTNTIPASSALVRKDFKYMNWPDYNFEQLFDLKEDPLETKDLINKTKFEKVVAEMRVRYSELATAAK